MKSCGVTIQMKSLQQFFHMLIFVFRQFEMEFGTFAIFFPFTLATTGSETKR